MAIQGRFRLVARRPVRRKKHGGERVGAGRKPNGPKAGEKHGVRPWISRRDPVHVVLRVTPEVGGLRRRSAYQAFRRAVWTAAAREDFRVVHVSIQRTHVHLVCEADDRMALSRGVRGLSISAAHRLNAAISDERGGPRRRGRVFVDRYHAVAITSPKQARNVLAYVLNNWRHHREDGGRLRRAVVDPYASGVWFTGWAGRDDSFFVWPRGYEPLPVVSPRTWLLREGWQRGGPPLDVRAIPGPPLQAHATRDPS
jgi:putative transposase